MRHFFGRDRVSFTAHTEDPHALMANRSFTSFSQAAREDALSRLWLGVHYRWDLSDGLAVGSDVADYLVAHTMLPTSHGRPPRR